MTERMRLISFCGSASNSDVAGHSSLKSNRRAFLATSLAPLWLGQLHPEPKLRVRSFELIPARATTRTVWLRTDQGLSGLAEASDAFGFLNTTKVPQHYQAGRDCHSFFDVPLAQSVARGLEQYHLAWYEEPAAPERTEEALKSGDRSSSRCPV